MRLSSRAITFLTLATAAAVAVPVALAATGGNGTPANKAVAAASRTATVTQNGEQKILSATFRTSKPEDLLISLSAECSILTDVVIAGSGTPGATDDQTAQGAVQVYLKLDDQIVSLTDTSAPPQDPAAATPGDKVRDAVTFCDRIHRRVVGDSENAQDGIDSSRDYQLTKQANAFNWVRLNAGSGIHTLEAWAVFTTSATTPSDAKAYIGKRTLIIEPTKLANDAVIG